MFKNILWIHLLWGLVPSIIYAILVYFISNSIQVAILSGLFVVLCFIIISVSFFFSLAHVLESLTEILEAMKIETMVQIQEAPAFEVEVLQEEEEI